MSEHVREATVGEVTRAAGARLRRLRALVPAGLTLALSVAVAGLMIAFQRQVSELGRWGYVGVFAAELGHSAAIIIPTPGPAVAFALGPVLDPWLIGLIGGVGSALGEVVGYVLGVRSRQLVVEGRYYRRARQLAERWTGPFIFAFAVLPVPFDFAGIWAGAIRYSVWRFLLLVAAGKIIKVAGIAWAGYYGISWVLETLERGP